MIVSTHGILKPLTIRYSINYGGGDEHATVPAASISFTNKTFTLNLWLKTSLITQCTIFSKGGTFATLGFNIQINPSDVSGVVRFAWNNGGSVSHVQAASTGINDGAWHKLTMVITTSTTVTANNNAVIYVDDVSKSTTSSKSSVYNASSSNIAISARAAGTGDFYTGYQYEPTVWDTGLSLAEIQALTPTLDYSTHSQYANLISNWRALPANYPSINDLKGGFTATMQNMESTDINTDVPT